VAGKKKDRRLKRERRHQAKLKAKIQKSLSKAKKLTPEVISQPKQVQKPLPPASHQPHTALAKINNTLKYIQSNPNINKSDEISNNLAAAMRLAIGDRKHVFDEDGESNKYWTLSPDWDGDESTLISHVTWTDVPNDPKVEKYLEKVETSKWGSKENHERYLASSRQQAYRKATEDLKIDVGDQMIEQLEGLMNSSVMWTFIGDQYGLGTKYYESEDAKHDWDEMFRTVSDFLNEGNTSQRDLDRLITMLNNPSKEDLNSVKSFLDDTLKTYRKR
jgi:hypothetical protein